ncbi:PKD domain-containing protein [Sphingobacterium sp. LRF_L2]|uniref:PKD domain-containing protein n=1 Tax=Sphingobacterium sp. LRF_L2 TaxID=3369421 RepID=UPI003F642C8D
MMKDFKYLYAIVASMMFLFGCAKQEITSIGQQGEYISNFDFPTGQIYAPGKVFLTNRSKNADRFLWEFSDAKTITAMGDTIETGNTDKMVPDTLFYELPGEYEVKLTTWKDGEQKETTKKLVVQKQQPAILVPENIGVFLEVTFSAQVFKFPGKQVTYDWDFGASGKSTEANPKVTFTVEGPQLVTLTVNDGEETLTTETIVLVQGELAKTIYFTDAFTRRVYKYKLTTNTQSEVESVGITTGYNAFGLSVKGSKLYLSETGFGTRFSSGDAAIADGALKSYNLDGTGENLITKPVASALDYRDDPWMHTVDKNGNIWWTCRNWGVRVLNAGSSEAAYPSIKFNINATIAGEGVSTYFASDIKEVGNEIWVSYAGTTGKGIYKYGLDGNYISKFSTAIQSHAIRAFVVDQVNSQIYFATNRADAGRTEGLYRANLDGSNIVAIDNGSTMLIGTGAYSNQGAAGEYIYITNLDIDVDENGEGYLYYGYRSNTDINGSGNPPTLGSSASNSGIKRYKLDGSEVPSFLVKGYAPYGLAIDQVKR